MIEIRFPIDNAPYKSDPESLRKAYLSLRDCVCQINSLKCRIRDDLDDLRMALRITEIGLCAGDWERIEVIRQRLNKGIEELRQAHEDFPRYQKIYTDLHHSLSGSQDLSHDSKAREGS